MAVDSIVLELEADNNAGRGVRQAERDLDKLERNGSRALGRLGKAAAIAGAAIATVGVAGIAGLRNLAADAANANFQFQQMSARLGTTVMQTEALAFAAGKAGTELQDIGDLIVDANERAQDALRGSAEAQAEFAEGAGISAAEFLALDQIGQIEAVARAYRDAEGDLERQADLQRIFGTQTAETQSALKSFEGGLDAYAQSLEDSGLILDNETRAGLEAFYDSLQAGEDNMTRFRNLMIRLFVLDVFPRYQQAMDNIVIPGLRDLARVFTQVVFPALRDLWRFVASNFIPTLETLAGFMRRVLEPALAIVQQGYVNLQTSAQNFVNFINDTIIPAWEDFKTSIEDVRDEVDGLENRLDNFRTNFAINVTANLPEIPELLTPENLPEIELPSSILPPFNPLTEDDLLTEGAEEINIVTVPPELKLSEDDLLAFTQPLPVMIDEDTFLTQADGLKTTLADRVREGADSATMSIRENLATPSQNILDGFNSWIEENIPEGLQRPFASAIFTIGGALLAFFATQARVPFIRFLGFVRGVADLIVSRWRAAVELKVRPSLRGLFAYIDEFFPRASRIIRGTGRALSRLAIPLTIILPLIQNWENITLPAFQRIWESVQRLGRAFDNLLESLGIEGGLTAVIGFLVAAFDGLFAIIDGLVITAFTLLTTAVDGLFTGLSIVTNLIAGDFDVAMEDMRLLVLRTQEAFDNLGDFLGGKFIEALKGAANAIIFVFEALINGVVTQLNTPIRAWNALNFEVPSVSIPNPFGGEPLFRFGGAQIGVPQVQGIPFVSIPRLQSGGYVTNDGLAFLHRGEFVNRAANVDRGRQNQGVTNIFNFTYNGNVTDRNRQEQDIIAAVRKAQRTGALQATF